MLLQTCPCRVLRQEVGNMAHEILYQLGIGGDDAFQTFTLVWEPHTNRVSLRFRNKREAANGLVGSV